MQLADRGIRIYGLNWQEERREDALDYLETMGNPYVAVAEDSVGDVAIDWGVYGAPETFLIGPDGTILHKYIRALTAEVWEREFLPVIEAHQQ
jgi:cytochrome c biogenesis protein CcmG/thiol:disulfide interchange protein DsbE